MCGCEREFACECNGKVCECRCLRVGVRVRVSMGVCVCVSGATVHGGKEKKHIFSVCLCS